MPPESAAAEESLGQSAKTAFASVRDAIPASTIENVVSHIPGGGMATSAFKAAKGLGGLGFALGSAGATAVSKKRRASKASAEHPNTADESPGNDTGPTGDSANNAQNSKIQANGVSTSPESPSILKPSLTRTRNENISGYGPAPTMYYARKTDQGISPDTGYLGGYVAPGAYSPDALPPVTQYSSVQPYTDEDGVEHDNLDFMHTVQENYPRTDGHMQPLDDYAPTSEIINTTHQLEPVVHERVHRIEVEEVTRQIIHDRHIHHIQHHTQPVIVREILEEKHHEKVHQPTTVFERHVNNADDLKVLDAHVRRHGNTKEYLEPEHFVIDKGSLIQENVHHHIHHIVQPVFEKETMDNHRTHTGIPIKEAIHDLTRSPQSVNDITETGDWEEKRKSIIPDAQLVRSPSIHCRGCKCHEMNPLSESFEKSTNIDEPPRQDTGIPGINGDFLRDSPITVM